MPMLALALCLLAPAPVDDLDRLQGEWRGSNGTTIIIVENRVGIFRGEEEFTGRLVVRLGLVHVVVGGQTAFRAPYKIEGDRLTLTVDGVAVEYRRKAETVVG